MKEVTKVPEIEIKVWTCIDLLTILNKLNNGRLCCAKIATAQKLLLVCTFQYSERSIMSMEEISEVRKWCVALWHIFFLSEDIWHRKEHSELKRKCDEDQSPCLHIQASFLSPDLPWPSSLRMTQGQYRTKPGFQSCDLLWPISLRIVHSLSVYPGCVAEI